MRGIGDYFILLIKGACMGIADLIPGVSGGTVAFITGIYEELVKSINSIDRQALRFLIKFRIKALWEHTNGWFLLCVLAGVAVSVLGLSRLIHFLIKTEPIAVWSLFFGLILISSLSVGKKIVDRSLTTLVFVPVGIITGFLVVSIAPFDHTPNNFFFIFISGAIAICAMILPGISGSFILLILGKYYVVLGALKDFDVVLILTFISGCVVGILSFSRVVSFLFDRYHDKTIAVLSGFMLGSLYKVWPWRIVDQYRINSSGEQVPFIETNVLPDRYALETGNDPQIVIAILFFALGIILVVALEKISIRKAQVK